MTESQALPEVEAQRNGGEALAVAATSTEKVGSKRQRRPSVRLGDIGGDQSVDSLNLNRRSTKHKQHKTTDNKSSKNRSQFHETLDGGEANLDSVAIGSWKVGDSKSKHATSTKRIRSNWASKIHHDDDDSGAHGEDEDIDDNDENEDEDGFKEFDSDSPWVKDSEYERDGVRVWLNQLGLGRYAPVFEIHEVDDEVLPMLTLEDLKDMGINAVGSRRKMYASIQKLGKGFS